MFSLKLDLLFPGRHLAKATAKKLKASWRGRPAVDVDPRELRRIQEELREAKLKADLFVATNRRLFL
jgi:hypothetical protein